MNKEPLGLYIFRFLTGFGLFAFMMMLYWSSEILEQDYRQLHSDIIEIKNDLRNMRDESEHTRNELLKALAENPGVVTQGHITTIKRTHRPHIDESLPNLLQEDPFYLKTLPKLLGERFKPHGTFHSAASGRPDNLHPFSAWAQVSAWNGQCTVAVAKSKFGIYETFAPDMAIKMEERIDPKTQKPEYWIHLRDQVFWHPLKPDLFSENMNLAPQFLKKQPVTAHDFKFYWDAIMNPNVQEAGAVTLRNYLSEIEEFKVIDDLTFVVRWKTHELPDANGKMVPKVKYLAKVLTGSLRPLPSFVYKYFANGKKIFEDDADPDTYRTNSVWAQNFSQHWAKNVIVSCGAWIFDGMTEREIRFKRNPDFYEPLMALAEKDIVEIKDSPDGIWKSFKEGRLDSYSLQPQQAIELDEFLKTSAYQTQKNDHNEIKKLQFVGRSYSYIGWNEATPYFNSKKVRQAMTMAIDRDRIIQQYMNGDAIPINGTMYRYSPNYDESIPLWPFDPYQARRLLEEEGWYDSDGDGIIDKEINGKRQPFRFRLTYYVKSALTKSICEYIAIALKHIGIQCDLNGVDVADLSAAFDDKSFDAICLSWSLGSPPEDPRQLWYSSGAKERGSSNMIGFANAEVDHIIDRLDYEYNPEERLKLYHRFDAIIHEEAPYTFLFTPKITLVYREYLQNVFIPADRQDLIPGANVAEPVSDIYWIKTQS